VREDVYERGRAFKSSTGLESLQLQHWLNGNEKKYDFGDSFPESLRKRRQAEYDRYFGAKARVEQALLEAGKAKLVFEGARESPHGWCVSKSAHAVRLWLSAIARAWLPRIRTIKS